LQALGDLFLGRERLIAVVSAGELGIGLDLVIGQDRGAGQGNEAHMTGVHRSTGDDPARLAGVDQPDLARVDADAGSQGIDGADGVSGQQAEVALIPRTTLPLGLSPPLLS
jgi:hypothetical protein